MLVEPQSQPPVHSLLDDILVLIFQFFPATYPLLPGTDRTWLSITHVCHRWRKVSISYPPIWAKIQVTGIRAFEFPREFLKRSGDASVEILTHVGEAGTTPPAGRAVALAALEHIYHSRMFTLYTSSAQLALSQCIPAFMSQQARVLESFILYCKPSTDSQSKSFLLPDDIFPEGLPRLTQLFLYGSGLTITWNSNLFVSNLTCLCVKGLSYESRPTMDQLLSVLRRMACLTDLALSDSLPPFDISHPETSVDVDSVIVDTVSLPHLQHLDLCDDIPETTEVLRRLNIPQVYDFAIRVRCETVDVRDEPSNRLSRVIRTALSTRGEMTVDSFIFADRGSSCQWVLSMGLEIGPFPRSVHGLLFEVLWRDVRLPDAPPATVPLMFNQIMFATRTILFPVSNASRVVLHTHYPAPSWAWALLSQLRATTSFSLHGFCSYGFAHALAQDQNGDLLPNLRELHFANAHFDYPLGSGQLEKCLHVALGNRHSAGRSPLRIWIENTHITAKQAKMLALYANGEPLITGEPETWGVGGSEYTEDEDSEEDIMDEWD